MKLVVFVEYRILFCVIILLRIGLINWGRPKIAKNKNRHSPKIAIAQKSPKAKNRHKLKIANGEDSHKLKIANGENRHRKK